MKSTLLCLLLICASTVVFAQTSTPKVIEGKPTFEQTFEYLQNNFKKTVSCYANTKQYSNSAAEADYKITSFVLKPGTDSIVLSYQRELTAYRDYIVSGKYINRYKLIFSLKDIESMEAIRWAAINGTVTIQNAVDGTFPIGIKLNAVNSNPVISVYSELDGVSKWEKLPSFELALGNYSKSDNVDLVLSNFKNSQLFKAFDHLRKLYGAPEPLRF